MGIVKHSPLFYFTPLCVKMNIYVYNSSTINEYSIDDCFSISSSIVESIDYGNIGESDIENFEVDNFSTITCLDTLYPFGQIKIKSSEKVIYKKISIEFKKIENLNKKSIILNGLILTWYGYGTVFEFNNGLERQVIPDVSGGGTIR